MNSLKRTLKQLNEKLFPAEAAEKGFSLMEIAIVLAIIGLIAGFVITNVSGRFSKAQTKAAEIQIRQLTTLVEQFRLDCYTYPTTEMGLEALVSLPEGVQCDGYEPLLKSKDVPKDPWGAKYQYFSDGNSFEIVSFGSDRKEGGDGNAADISSKNLE